MKNTKSILTILFIALIASFSTSCKKDKTKVQTELPANYTNQGSITVVKKNITICIYDSEAEDGDVVDLFFNGNTLINNYEILNEEKCFNVTLENGNNWIGINVDNEGSSPPATVAVKIKDGVTEQQFTIDGEIGKPGGYIIKL